MTQNAATFFGQSKGISFIVITSNLEFSSTYRKKKHSQFHIQTWICCKKAELTIVVALLWIEIYRTHGPDWRSSLYWMRSLLKDVCGPGGLQKLKQPPDLTICGPFLARNVVQHLRSSSTKRKSSDGLSTNRSSTMRESWETFTLSIRMMESSRKPWKTHGKVEDSGGRCYAL